MCEGEQWGREGIQGGQKLKYKMEMTVMGKGDRREGRDADEGEGRKVESRRKMKKGKKCVVGEGYGKQDRSSEVLDLPLLGKADLVSMLKPWEREEVPYPALGRLSQEVREETKCSNQ